MVLSKELLRYNFLTQKDPGNIEEYIWWNCTDFDEFLEEEGFFFTLHTETNLDLLFLNANMLNVNVDDKLYSVLQNSKTVIILYGLQSAACPGFIYIPETWPNRNYILFYGMSHCDYSSNVTAYHFDYAYDSYRKWWFRRPFNGRCFFGASNTIECTAFRFANINQRPKTKIAICAARYRPCQKARMFLHKIFSENSQWSAYTAFKEHIGNSDPEDNQTYDHLIGMKDDPLHLLNYDIFSKTYSHKFSKIDELPKIEITKSNIFQQSNLIHFQYFEDSFLSIYGESVEECISPTEKTWAPFLNGHFILPFSGCGFIEYLKNKGWEFPDFIDYSYDKEPDYQTRINLYGEEIKRLMNIPHKTWEELYVENIHILAHNRLKMFQDPYFRLGLKNNETYFK